MCAVGTAALATRKCARARARASARARARACARTRTNGTTRAHGSVSEPAQSPQSIFLRGRLNTYSFVPSISGSDPQA